MKIVKERKKPEGSLGLGAQATGQMGRPELGRGLAGNVLVPRYQAAS